MTKQTSRGHDRVDQSWAGHEVVGPFMAHKRAFFFIDNESSKASLINSGTAAWSTRRVLRRVVRQVMKSSFYPWYARVPTASNPADAPSRFDLNEVLADRAHQDVVDWVKVWRE